MELLHAVFHRALVGAAFVVAAIYSVLLFGDRIDAAGWAGMTLIVCSGIAATVLRQRSLPRAPAEEH